MAIKYGGKTTPDYSAMRGPSPDEFHVPSKDEWVALCGILTSTFGLASDDTTMGTYLKMPPAGYRNYTNANIYNVGSNGRYWSSTPYNTNYVYNLYFSSYNIGPQDTYRRSYGYSVRCFKNEPTVPTSSWTTLYDGSSIATGAGVFYNATDGLISVSGDGTTWYTIMDKNLGATTVYSQGDTETDANCGYFFQWGNNYGFPHSGNVTTSSTQVDASNYGPGNYYNSGTFITGSNDWSSVQNDDLRGGETGVQQLPAPIIKRYYGGKLINDLQGPAPYGFHIPTVDEWEGLYDIMSGLYLSSGEDWQENLHIPLASYRTSSGSIYEYPDLGIYWSSSPNTNSQNNAYCLDIRHNNVGPNVSTRRSYGLTIRAFKDSYVEATDSWTVITGLVGNAGIFWNQSEGLITISDGAWGYTIMDKNLGATTVYNYGDTLTDANIGYMYQWGNNYGFPSTGSISNTSSTQVDASNYGPNTDNGYYSSDTFITGSNDWSSVHNDNLWGGITQGQHPAEVIEVYYGSTKVWPIKHEFYYDFIEAGSVAKMQSDGWVFGRQSGTATDGWEITSNGFHNTNTPSSFGGIAMPHGLNIHNAEKITVIANVYILKGSWNGGSSFGMSDSPEYGGGTYGVGGSVNSMYNSGYNGYAVYAGNNSNWNRTSISTNSYTVTLTLDLINKIATINLPGYTDRTLSLSDSDVSSIKTLQYTNIGFDNVGCYYKNIRLIFE